MENVVKENFTTRLGTAIFVLAPILGWYAIPFPVSLGNAMILFFSAYSLIKSGFKINILPKSFAVVFGYISLLWIHNNNYSLWTLLPPGGWMFFIFVLGILSGTRVFDRLLAVKYMKYVVWIAIALFWVQFAAFIVSGGHNQFCFVPSLTGNFTYESLTYAELVARHLDSDHPSSIFLEKSYMAYYILAYLAFTLYNDSNKKWLDRESFIIIVTLIALRSGSGMVGLVVLLVVRAYQLFWNENRGRRVLMAFILVPISIGAFYLYRSTDTGQEILSRQEEFTTEGSSGYTRVVAGFLIYDSMDAKEKIIGTPNAIEQFGVERKDGSIRLYLNGIQSILIGAGIIGLLLYLIFYISLFKKVPLNSGVFIILLLAMALLEYNYLNPYMMLLTIIPCSDYYRRKKL